MTELARLSTAMILVFLFPRAILFFFFNDTATTEIYTLSLHDALPICASVSDFFNDCLPIARVIDLIAPYWADLHDDDTDRKSTRLNSSHLVISYAVFCLKKKTETHLNSFEKPSYAHPTCILPRQQSSV